MSMRALAALSVALVPFAASACGVCIDDRIAATYDHHVATQAAGHHHAVVFASMTANADARVVVREARRAAGRVRGVDAGTVRSAAEPLGLSFAIDPKVQTPARALADIERGVAVPGFTITLLRVVRADASGGN